MADFIPSWVQTPPPPIDLTARAEATARQATLTKPPGSLGRLEALAIELAGMQGRARPRADAVAFILFAGDHGIVAQGVSAFPQDVTVQMLANFAAGGAAISVLARLHGASLTVVDVGTIAEAPVAGVITDKIARGSQDFSQARALSKAELVHALEAGRRAVEAAGKASGTISEPGDLLVLGEMGIGNTTAATAMLAALANSAPHEITGAGTGLDADGQTRKAEVISATLAHHDLLGRKAHAADVLGAVGGHEIAALVGAIIAAAQRGTPVLVDGFIVSVAALAACQLNPRVCDRLLFAHVSAERGHRYALDALEASALLDLGMRLGEASGAAVALPIVRAACALHAEMATFAEAAVSEKR
ncbi:MAG: nicotinate-nucleotide--dimethylbenzimidazole phosphoribosyltransferase [Pseudomonadota bacterium]